MTTAGATVSAATLIGDCFAAAIAGLNIDATRGVNAIMHTSSAHSPARSASRAAGKWARQHPLPSAGTRQIANVRKQEMLFRDGLWHDANRVRNARFCMIPVSCRTEAFWSNVVPSMRDVHEGRRSAATQKSPGAPMPGLRDGRVSK